MTLTLFIAFISLIGLMVLHEFGHFIIAKKLGIKVEEFGIGYPPRLFAKKIGETLYSLNLVPFGAFVKIYGEQSRQKDKASFSERPIFHRVLVVLGGVISFWLIAVLLLSLVMTIGAYVAIEDEAQAAINPRVQIMAVAPDSPAGTAGLQAGDVIKQLSVSDIRFSIDKVKQVQELTNQHLGEEIVLKIQRGGQDFDVKLAPRPNPPSGQGAIGVTLVRTALEKYAWYLAPQKGISATLDLTSAVLQGWLGVLNNLFSGKETGVQIMGPVGIFAMFGQVAKMGASYFLQFVAMIAVYLALFNLLPIPALDGGKLLFLGIEAVRQKPVSFRIEQKITGFFFAFLIALMILVTIQDIIRIF